MAHSDVAPIVPLVIQFPVLAETPGRSLWFAFGWIMASLAAAGLAGLFVGLAYRADHAIGMPPPIFITLASGTSLQLVLLFAAFIASLYGLQ